MAEEFDVNRPFKPYVEGQDTPTIITPSFTIDKNGKRIWYALALADYAEMADAKERGYYDKIIQEMWDDDYLRRGLDIRRTGDNSALVTSKRTFAAWGFHGEHQHQITAPSFKIDLSVSGEGNGKVPCDGFFKLAEASGEWVLHLRTSEWSYIYILDYLSGALRGKTRIPKVPLSLNYQEGGRGADQGTEQESRRDHRHSGSDRSDGENRPGNPPDRSQDAGRLRDIEGETEGTPGQREEGGPPPA